MLLQKLFLHFYRRWFGASEEAAVCGSEEAFFRLLKKRFLGSEEAVLLTSTEPFLASFLWFCVKKTNKRLQQSLESVQFHSSHHPKPKVG